MASKNIQVSALREFLPSCFAAAGVPNEMATEVSEGLILTSLRGVDSHGIRLAPHYIAGINNGRINPHPKWKFETSGPSSGRLDADHTFGICAANRAMDHCIELAKKSGMAGVAVHNSSHFAAAALYGQRATRAGMIGLAFTQAEGTVLPHGGAQPFFGTNPICFCAPCREEEPFCLDMATSVVPRNKILHYKENGFELEEGWAADEKGQPVRDAKLARSLMPIGGYKGYGLAMMVEILCSLLTGAPFGPQVSAMYPADSQRRRLGHFMMAIDISHFQDVEVFRDRMQAMMDQLRASPPTPDGERVKVAGDPEKEARQIREQEGIPVTDAQLESFLKLADELKVDSKILH